MSTAPTPGTEERLAARRRPEGPAVMYQSWRSLLFLHWAFPPEAVRPLLPAGLDLDTFDGKAYVGLVPFTMRGVRPRGLPAVPWLSSFHETNVRTYVHVAGRNPGVWFFSLEAANPVAVALARAWFHLPYYHARMSLVADPVAGTISYESRRLRPASATPATSSVRCRPAGSPAPAAVGTLDHFLVERYDLYAFDGTRLHRGRVHHSPYPVQSAELLDLDETLLAASGLARPEVSPSVLFSGGVDVEIFPLRRLVKS